jgi:CheY-like chemotaxis protein
VDLAIIDTQMPGMDGFECCRRIKRIKTPATPKTIIITGTIDAVSDALFFGRRIPTSEARRVAEWVAGRQGLPGSYANIKINHSGRSVARQCASKDRCPNERRTIRGVEEG